MRVKYNYTRELRAEEEDFEVTGGTGVFGYGKVLSLANLVGIGRAE